MVKVSNGHKRHDLIFSLNYTTEDIIRSGPSNGSERHELDYTREFVGMK